MAASFMVASRNCIPLENQARSLKSTRRCSPGALLLLATAGAYAVRGLVIDVIVMIVAGVAGFFFRRSGYSVACIVLGSDPRKNR